MSALKYTWMAWSCHTPKTWRRLALHAGLLLLVGWYVLLTGTLSGSKAGLKLPSRPSGDTVRRDVPKEYKQDATSDFIYVVEPVKLFQYESRSQGMAPQYPATFLHSLRPLEFPYDDEGQVFPLTFDVLSRLSEEELLPRVLRGFTVPTHSCRRMVRMGGSYCVGKNEAEKVICFDSVLKPVIGDCLVYSFGVGHEISFDKAIADYGCKVFAFDSDYYHMNYPRYLHQDVIFLKVRLGWSKMVTVLTDPSGRFPFVYRPIDDIMDRLGHTDANIAILKMDIENSEWDVFEKSIFKTRILERTHQLALEVHLDYLYPGSQFDPHPEGRWEGLKQQARVLQGLHNRGFKLVYYEPNYNIPVNVSLHGRTFHVYFETVWINTHPLPGTATKPTPDLTNFDPLPPIDIIHYNV